jgi:phenylalanyl-tRNA synthetase alpha chain
MISFKQINLDSHVLTNEGSLIATNGSHEYLVWSALPPPSAEAGLTAKEIEAKVGKDTAKVGQGKAMKNKWVTKKGDGFLQAVRFFLLPFFSDEMLNNGDEQVATVEDTTRNDLLSIQSTGAHSDEKLLAELRKRKLVEKKCVLSAKLFRRLLMLSPPEQEDLLLLGCQG